MYLTGGAGGCGGCAGTSIGATSGATSDGIHVSGGTGLRYSYIDLALTDFDRGVVGHDRQDRAHSPFDEVYVLDWA